MIELDAVTKTFPGAPTPSVDAVSMTIPEGETVALIGPSGCGKTTTLRMINRLIEPTAGRILVAGHDITHGDPILLRRTIGYVIQNVGLFPHMTVGQNIAAVPRLLGWDTKRIDARTDELLHLVGLDPAMRTRRPAALSGGQRQRVGVARALAADPPVMLMDEPFGAIDPIARTRLQDEFKAILRRVRKTVVMVTHDMEEALRMADRIAIMRNGKLLQFDTPATILTSPADPFVDAFLGPDRAFRRLALQTVDGLMTPASGTPDPALPSGTTLREALSTLITARADTARIVAPDGTVLGELTRAAILAA
ncbi:MAG: ABC transporter ATP-binding protein [Janthinobacterium lividum]